MSQDLTLYTLEGKLNIRVAAWIEKDDRILVSEFPDGTISLPGGRMKFGESSFEAVQREIYEETSENLSNPRLFAVIENFFTIDQAFHEILFVYAGELPYHEQYKGIDQHDQKLYWLSLNNIGLLKPAILSHLVNNKNSQDVLHLVNHEHSLA